MEIIKNFIIKYYKPTLNLLIGLFVLYWVIVVLTPSSTMTKEDKNKLDSLANTINQINKKQDSLEFKVESLNKELVKVDYNILKIKTNKIKIGKKYHEEIIRVDEYTESELDSFFSNRYK